jgi:xanthine dehydrogenase YagS FAD-binding subunit
MLAAYPDARVLAGGTDLVALVKDGAEETSLLVDIRDAVPATITTGPAFVRLGAAARLRHVAEATRATHPVIAEALELSASPQIRNAATVGGNLLQRTRCPWFRDTAPPACNKRRPGTGCATLTGHGRHAALFGWSEQCAATHPSDLAVALAILDADVRVRSARGERVVPLADLHRTPGDDATRDHHLMAGEIITAVDVPRVPWARASRYVKVRERASFEFALVSAAVAWELEGTRVRTARIALGGVAPKPWRLGAAEEALHGVVPTAQTVRDAVAAAMADARPTDENRFKIELATRAVVRAAGLIGARS